MFLVPLTWFERLDGDWGGVVPETLPDLAELPVAQLADEFEARAFDLPLVTGRVGQALRRGLVNLKKKAQNIIGRAKKLEACLSIWKKLRQNLMMNKHDFKRAKTKTL